MNDKIQLCHRDCMCVSRLLIRLNIIRKAESFSTPCATGCSSWDGAKSML